MMKQLTITLLLFSLVAYTQTQVLPKTDFAKMYLPVWLEAKEHCLAVANAMPEELYSYKPTEVSKTFAEQMVHK